MAGPNTLTLDARGWIDPREWAASPWLHAPYLAEMARVAREAKQRQVLRGVGSDGQPLEPRIRPRADGATGKPLTPHRTESRTYKWVRASVSRAKGTVSVFWSHGWQKILTYHAEGRVIGTYKRDVIGFPPGVLAWLKGRGRRVWAELRDGRRPIREDVPARLILPPAMPAIPRVVPFVPRATVSAFDTFRSDAERDAYARALAAGRTTGQNVGGVRRTGPRLIRR